VSVHFNGPLTATERAVFEHLAKHNRGPCSSAAISDDTGAPTESVRVHVSNLRRKLNPPLLIATVRGLGYQLTLETEMAGCPRCGYLHFCSGAPV